jgi:hypothetical protein
VAAQGSRPRAAVPRERSGPIGISKGDFATPIVRRRTTTQPRGIPVTGGAAPAAEPDVHTNAPAPAPAAAPAGTPPPALTPPPVADSASGPAATASSPPPR